MPRIKRANIIIGLLVFILILSGSGCNKSNNDSQVQSAESQLQYSLTVYRPQLAESPTHYYHIVGSYLYSISKDDGQVRVVDNNPDSLDDAETDSARMTDSNAYFHFPRTVQYIGDKLYVWTLEPTEKTPTPSAGSADSTLSVLYEADPGGGPQKKILTIEEDVYDLLIHKGYIYFTTSDASSEISKIRSGELTQEELDALQYHVKRIPLDHPEQDAEIVYSEYGYDLLFMFLKGRGDNLYFNDSGNLAIEYSEKKEDHAWLSNLETLETLTLPISNVSLVSEGIVQVKKPDTVPSLENATLISESILLYDEKGEFKEEVTLERPMYAYGFSYSYGDYLCQDNIWWALQLPDQKRVLQIVRIDGKFVAEIEVPEDFGASLIVGMTDQTIFMQARQPDGEIYQEIYQVNFLETGDGKPEWEPFFTYQPPRKMD